MTKHRLSDRQRKALVDLSRMPDSLHSGGAVLASLKRRGLISLIRLSMTRGHLYELTEAGELAMVSS